MARFLGFGGRLVVTLGRLVAALLVFLLVRHSAVGTVGEEGVAAAPSGHALAPPREGAVSFGVGIGGVRAPLKRHTAW